MDTKSEHTWLITVDTYVRCSAVYLALAGIDAARLTKFSGSVFLNTSQKTAARIVRSEVFRSLFLVVS